VPIVIDQLWRYPVKSMQGERVPSVTLTPLGVAGDRLWATRDHVRGGIRGAKQLGTLMQLAAQAAADDIRHAVITLPDGTEVRTDAPDVSDWLSAALDHPVTLEPLHPADDLDHYRRGPSDAPDPMTGLREVFALDEGDPLPDFTAFPPEVVEFESPPGTYYDCWPLLVLSGSSLRALQALAPSSVIDVRRFRPSILVETDEEGFPEHGWSGRHLAAGDAVLELLSPAPRCVMVTRPFAELPEDRSIMRTLVRETRQCLGAYARVSTPGTIREGDVATFV
jgi:uncharacterized protein YcbX